MIATNDNPSPIDAAVSWSVGLQAVQRRLEGRFGRRKLRSALARLRTWTDDVTDLPIDLAAAERSYLRELLEPRPVPPCAVSLRIEPGVRVDLEDAARACGENLSAFVREAIRAATAPSPWPWAPSPHEAATSYSDAPSEPRAARLTVRLKPALQRRLVETARRAGLSPSAFARFALELRLREPATTLHECA